MKIAFCFLTYENLDRPDIWNSFFKNADLKKYSAVIHPKNILAINNFQYDFPVSTVKNIIYTKNKTDISIIRATIRLLETAYKDEEITHFLFLSQSCMPLYDFDTIYKIVTHSDRSIISNIKNNKKERYFQLSKELQKYMSYEKFTKQQPNMMLVRQDVYKIIQNQNLVNHFNNMTCPDEHYFVNILILLGSDIIFNQIVFCNFNLSFTQAKEFMLVDDKLKLNIKKLGFLFMRKVTKKTIVI
jgi:hypothetical protein